MIAEETGLSKSAVQLRWTPCVTASSSSQPAPMRPRCPRPHAPALSPLRAGLSSITPGVICQNFRFGQSRELVLEPVFFKAWSWRTFQLGCRARLVFPQCFSTFTYTLGRRFREIEIAGSLKQFELALAVQDAPLCGEFGSRKADLTGHVFPRLSFVHFLWCRKRSTRECAGGTCTGERCEFILAS